MTLCSDLSFEAPEAAGPPGAREGVGVIVHPTTHLPGRACFDLFTGWPGSVAGPKAGTGYRALHVQLILLLFIQMPRLETEPGGGKLKCQK